MRRDVGVTYPVVEIVSPPDDFADEHLAAFRLHVRGGEDFLDDASLTPVLQRFLNAAALDAEATSVAGGARTDAAETVGQLHAARSR